MFDTADTLDEELRSFHKRRRQHLRSLREGHLNAEDRAYVLRQLAQDEPTPEQTLGWLAVLGCEYERKWGTR